MHLPTERQLWQARLLTDQLPGETQHAHRGAGHHTARVSSLVRAPAGSIMHGSPSPRSLHSTPIGRGLLMVAVQGCINVTSSSLWGPTAPAAATARVHVIRTPPVTPCTAAYRPGQAAAHPHCYIRRAQSHAARSGGVSLYLPETATLVYTTIAPMMPGLDNHLVETHRDLRCTRSRNCRWCALPMRCLCWPRAGV